MKIKWFKIKKKNQLSNMDQSRINNFKIKKDPKFDKLFASFNKFSTAKKYKNIKPLIEIANLHKSIHFLFKPKKDVLKDINLKIYSGDKIALLGANGAGKTTLLEILGGINLPTSGRINYNYKFDYTPQEKIGIQFQDASCPAGLTTYDLISTQNSILINPLNDEAITKLIKLFKLDDILTVKAARLSGGQQQRINIALTFMSQPEIFILDELSTALDIDMQFYINDLIKEHIDQNHLTLILSSHNVNEILFHTNRTVVLKQGKIIVDAFNDEIIKHFKSFDYFLTNIIND